MESATTANAVEISKQLGYCQGLQATVNHNGAAVTASLAERDVVIAQQGAVLACMMRMQANPASATEGTANTVESND